MKMGCLIFPSHQNRQFKRRHPALRQNASILLLLNALWQESYPTTSFLLDNSTCWRYVTDTRPMLLSDRQGNHDLGYSRHNVCPIYALIPDKTPDI
jgi:hypothetical protein